MVSLGAHLLPELSPQLERAVLCLPAAGTTGTPLQPAKPVPPGSAHGDLALARAAVSEDEAQQGSGESLSQTGPCQDKTSLIPCSLLKLQPPQQPPPQPARKKQEKWLNSDWRRLEGFMRGMLLQWRKRQEELEP